ncbi:sensor histidine kinase [Microaerobacter geothermalis]|uniref:sensor histidine kinase n=1 Tax=Microaerobacter geothermalis TaxID=674972 RepID=UPI001F2C33D5|nr:sensor histidine kinase [Microaerobacter geothermalis]
MKDQFISENYRLINQAKYEFSDYFQTITQIPLTLYLNRNLMNILEFGVGDDLERYQELKRGLFNLYSTRKDIKQLYLYIDQSKDELIVYNGNILSKKNEQGLAEKRYQRLIENQSYFSIEPTHRISDYGFSLIPKNPSVNVVSFHQSLKQVPSSQLLGFLSIDIDLKKIESIGSRLFTLGTEDFYLMDQDGYVVYSSDPSLIGRINNEKWYNQMKTNQVKQQSFDWKDSQFAGVLVYDRFSAPFDNWMIVKRIPYERLYKGARDIAIINILIGLFFLGIVIIATLFVSFRITSPIKILINNIKRIESGRLETNFDSLGNDEFGLLGKHFKSMIERINHLIDQEYRLEIENKINQFKVLQSQINPHFLYNSLQSIGTLALKNQGAQVYTLLTSLTQMMRYGMNIEENLVTLKREIEHAESYLVLQKQRFGEKFNYHIDVDSTLYTTFVPKMIFQPLIENYFKHGFDNSTVVGKLTIICKKIDHQRFQIILEDNGKGVSIDRLHMLQQMLHKDNGFKNIERNSIGLKNVYHRLKLYYGNQASMNIYTHQDGGFGIEIRIPIAFRGGD